MAAASEAARVKHVCDAFLSSISQLGFRLVYGINKVCERVALNATGNSLSCLCLNTESQNGLGWKGRYRSSSSNPPDMGRDTFH